MADALTRTHLIAPAHLIDEVDRLVGPRKRSEFIAAAVDEKLKREKLLQLTHEVSKLPPGGGIPEWDTPESTAKWLREGRADNRPIRKV
jgi:hypothetical protein